MKKQIKSSKLYFKNPCIKHKKLKIREQIDNKKAMKQIGSSAWEPIIQRFGQSPLEEQIHLMRGALACCSNGIVIVDANLPDRPIIYVNPAFERLTGYRSEEVIGHNCRFLQKNDTEQPEINKLRNAIEGAKECHVILRNYRKDGSLFWNELHLSPVFNEKRELTHFIGIQTDVTERKQTEAKLRHYAFYDSLTTLPNRIFFMDILEQNLKKASSNENYLFALLFLDLDEFKIINDSLGHSVGDRLLIAFARRLENCLRPSDTIARLGGDEFIILLPEIKNITDVIKVAERLYKQLQVPFKLDSYEVFVNASVGIVLGTPDSKEPQEMLRNADIAMYHAKTLGKGGYAVFDRQMHLQAVARLQIENDLRRACLRSEFELHYQPIVSLITGKAIGFEALLRWRHPERGLVSPAEFIPVAEKTGTIVPIGQWVLEQACARMKIWQEQFPQLEPLTIAVNISGKQLQQPDFTLQLDRILDRTGLDGQYLKLEITESILMENTEQIEKILMLIQKRKIKLSLDDFGTGYSSLSYLQRFPINTVKIDRSFVKSISSDPKNAAIVKAIVTLTDTLGMEAIAEGIETSNQQEQLRLLGCFQGQGYYFSKPLSAENTELFLKNLSAESKVQNFEPSSSKQANTAIDLSDACLENCNNSRTDFSI